GIAEEQRLNLEKQVEELEGKTVEREKHELERSLAIKYHKAKFFDRRKALRRLAQVHRKLKGDIEEDVRLGLERTRQSEETDLKYVLYFPKDKKYLPLEKGKEGPPRAQKTHERLLKAALGRGEAAGWTEFQENLEKFVTGDRGRKKRANVAAVEGAATGGEGGEPSGKRKKGLDGLAVVAQEKLWGDEEEEGEGEGEGEGGEGHAGGSREGGGGSGSADGGSVEEGSSSEGGEEEEEEEEEEEAKKAPEGTGSSRSTESDSEVELSGDEGFGAAASDEDDAYSFAEARMRWASGGGGTAATITGGDSSSDGGSSAGAEATNRKTAGGGLEGAGSASERGVTSDGSQSDDSVGDIYVGGPGGLPAAVGARAGEATGRLEGFRVLMGRGEAPEGGGYRTGGAGGVGGGASRGLAGLRDVRGEGEGGGE
ncbi:unnamed protein product, partial [Laminaria digitata]